MHLAGTHPFIHLLEPPSPHLPRTKNKGTNWEVHILPWTQKRSKLDPPLSFTLPGQPPSTPLPPSATTPFLPALAAAAFAMS